MQSLPTPVRLAIYSGRISHRPTPVRDGRSSACRPGTVAQPARPFQGDRPMPRGPGYVPPRWSVEVNTRTMCGFYLPPATSYFARVVVGVLCKAQEEHPAQIHADMAASDHYHLILTPDAGPLAHIAGSGLRRELAVGRRTGAMPTKRLGRISSPASSCLSASWTPCFSIASICKLDHRF